jgi:hypothetical protein
MVSMTKSFSRSSEAAEVVDPLGILATRRCGGGEDEFLQGFFKPSHEWRGRRISGG